MRIALLSCFYPYRGGISQFNSFLFKELSKKHVVKAFNFKRQYPSFLFPGKTQFVEKEDKAVSIESESLLDTANPLTYYTTAKKIAEWQPDILITRYWMSYFAPSLGYINRKVRKILKDKAKENNSSLFKTISITDNAIPHEPHFFDKPFAKYYFNSIDGFIAMSSVVKEEIQNIVPNAKVELIKHPLYLNYGTKIDKLEARKTIFENRKKINQEAFIQQIKNKRVLLFFGLIRDYKGLDLILKAMPELGNEYVLIVAGEPYEDFDKYKKIIYSPDFDDIRENIILKTEFIPDEQVKVLFSSCDLCVLPYKSATQSGICSVSWNFETPIIATPVGGLPEYINSTQSGIITERVDTASLVKSIKEFFDNKLSTTYINNIIELKKELSWDNFCNNLIDFGNRL